eukprot:jgi/Antlo1/1447/2542
MINAYRNEVWLLRRLLYKIKNQYKSTWMFRKMRHLSKLLQKNSPDALKCCEELYVVCSANLALGHFVSLTIVIMGICARLRFLLPRIRSKTDVDEIDAIFADF